LDINEYKQGKEFMDESKEEGTTCIGSTRLDQSVNLDLVPLSLKLTQQARSHQLNPKEG
jgi:hypothetical protein